MRYFFHFRGRQGFFADIEGTELSDNSAAREEGRVSARQLLGLDNGGRSRRFAGGHFEIVDTGGLLVGTVAFQKSKLA
jgi:hypothetical protein